MSVQSVLAEADKGKYKEGELLVKFKSGTISTASVRVHQAVGSSVVKRYSVVPGLEHVKLTKGLSIQDAIQQYMANPDVEYAEPNYIRRAMTIPNDTYFGNQWALHNTGTYAGGTADADMDAPEAWDISTGSSSIIAAVLDTGIDYSHSDLVGNIWTNLGETSCTDGIDNDGNGLVDDCKGWDFVNSDNDPMDDFGHGTHVAGTIGAVGNNGIGTAGVMWKVRLMPVKVLDSDGAGTDAELIAGIQYAASNGAKIINSSLGGFGFSNSLFDAIATANSMGVLFIAAAGNGGGDLIGDNNDLTPFYPASFDLPNIISVAATDQDDIRVPFSNFGLNSVDVAAPGVYIFSTVPNNLFSDFSNEEFFAGTSMATPHVAGLAGLLWSHYDGVHNTLFTASQVRATILRYVDVLPTLTGWIQTGGRVNAFKAVSSLLTPANLTATAKSPTEISLAWEDRATGEDGYKVERKISGGTFTEVQTLTAGSSSFTDSFLTPDATYTYRVRVFNTIAESFNSNEATATTPLRHGGSSGGCSIGARQNAATAVADMTVMLLPLIFIAIARRRK
jgi:subtilisin family serine protease